MTLFTFVPAETSSRSRYLHLKAPVCGGESLPSIVGWASCPPMLKAWAGKMSALRWLSLRRIVLDRPNLMLSDGRDMFES